MQKLFMDADCLIKISKAGLKELIVSHFQVTIHTVVQREVVDHGLVKKLPDAFLVRENIHNKKILIHHSKRSFSDGDLALQEEFDHQFFDAVATDDRKLIRFFKSKNIPYVLPALLVYLLKQKNVLTVKEALGWLVKLKPFISPDEFTTVKILLEK